MKNNLLSQDTIHQTQENRIDICEKINNQWKKYGGLKKVEIKIVGSIGDRDEIDTIKRITEVFVIERRIKNLIYPQESEE